MIYIFDGTEDGFLTAFLLAYHDENARLSSGRIQLTLDGEPHFVTADIQKAQKARERLLTFDKECMQELRLLLRCGEDDAVQSAFAYLKKLSQKRAPVRGQLTDKAVFNAMEKLRRIRYEIHRFHGFIRFIECENGALYAPFSPDNDICDLLLPHFKARLPQYPFVLHDITRKKAAVYDGKNSFVAYLPHAEVLLSANEEGWKSLWQTYYDAVNIPSRERLRQMRAFMPTRYWKFMPEKHN